MKIKLVKLFREFSKDLNTFLQKNPLEDEDYSFENFIRWCDYTSKKKQTEADARYYRKNRERIIKRTTEYNKKHKRSREENK